MIPVKLTIEGLYSYQQRQTIDFTDLTSAGLFGIFGATGSGKSSILEAISYALYGDTERLNRNDKRGYNMMNLRSDRAYISFDFYNYKDDLYRATRELKRNSKRFEDVRSPKVVFYQYKSGEWVPLEHTRTEEILDLTYDNFKRTIIIPQGHFKDFLELKPKDRRSMMKEIFRLHRFDLHQKTAVLKSKSQSDLDVVNGRLQHYESVTKEEMKNKKCRLKQVTTEYREAEEKYEEVQVRFQQLKQYREDFDRLKQKKQRLLVLEKQQQEIQKLEKELVEYERMVQVFYQPLVDLKRMKTEREKKEDKKNNAQKKRRATEKDWREKNTLLEKVQPYFDKLKQRRTEEEDLNMIARILEWEKDVMVNRRQRKEWHGKWQERKRKEKERSQQLEEEKSHIDTLKTQKTATNILWAVGDWFAEARKIKERQERQSEAVRDKEEELKRIRKGFTENEIEKESFDRGLKATQQQIDQQQKQLDQTGENLKVKKRLSAHAHDLKEGEACPLCGAREHPHILEEIDLSAELEHHAEAVEVLNRKKKKLREQEVFFIKQSAAEERIIEEKQKILKEMEEISAIWEEHREKFTWKEFNPDDEAAFRVVQKEAEALEKEITKNEEEVQRLRSKMEKEREELESYRDKLNEIEKEEHAKEARIESGKAGIKRLNIENYRGYDSSEVTALSEKRHRENNKIEQKHQILSEAVRNLEKKKAVLEATVMQLQEEMAEQDIEINTLGEQIASDIEKEQAGDIEWVRTVLKRQLDVSNTREKVKAFEIDFRTLKQSVSDLEHRLAAVSYSEELFRQEEQHWQNLKRQLQTKNEERVALKNRVTDLIKGYEEKKELLKKEEQLHSRVDNLQTMANLFKAAGFVEYVSSLYLSQLCAQANVRFQRMTRNQLALQLSRDNEFEVIDYLNEGRRRSVKTLSGGQAFQVSLSLALALADSVQNHAAAAKRFFFIDEGFGTQDPEALNIIFETLVHLNKENKIVGIISHVEALKDRIPKALEVEKNIDRGSLIRRTE